MEECNRERERERRREREKERERKKRKSARRRKVSASPSVDVESSVARSWVGQGRAGQGRVQKSIVVFTRRPRRDAAGFVAARAISRSNTRTCRFRGSLGSPRAAAAKKRDGSRAFYVIASCVSTTPLGFSRNRARVRLGWYAQLRTRTRGYRKTSGNENAPFLAARVPARHRENLTPDVIMSRRFRARLASFRVASPASRTMNRYESWLSSVLWIPSMLVQSLG